MKKMVTARKPVKYNEYNPAEQICFLTVLQFERCAKSINTTLAFIASSLFPFRVILYFIYLFFYFLRSRLINASIQWLKIKQTLIRQCVVYIVT
jgi:hypothetical protein